MVSVVQKDVDLRAALHRRVQYRSQCSGRLVFPAVPGLLDDYVKTCDGLFRQIGVTFSVGELNQLRDALASELAIAFSASARSEIVIEYESPTGRTVKYHVKAQWQTLDASYDNWCATRKPPLFGTEPDAKVWRVALTAPEPAVFPVLDIGAGTGRNAIALNRRGHPVDAVELTPRFAQMMRDSCTEESLCVRVIESDIFASAVELRDDYGLIVLSEVSSDFRSTQPLRQVLELAAKRLVPGGYLVMNAFLVKEGHVLDEAAFEFAQQCYCTFFTRAVLEEAVLDLPLMLESDESVHDYEKAHLPLGAWPPTGWYERWVSGQDVFDLPREDCPIELRWLVYRKAD